VALGEIAKFVPQRQMELWKPPTCGPTGYGALPFNSVQLETLDEVIGGAERVTGLRFSAFLGDLGADSRVSALSLLAGLGAASPAAVLIAISPEQRVVEVVTGAAAALRITDRSARLAVLTVISSATAGDLLGGLINGIRTLADQAGTLPDRSTW